MVKTHVYGHPQVGGSFNLPAEWMRKERFPFLTEFLACKANAAVILQEWNSTATVAIQPEAVINELENISSACMIDVTKVSSYQFVI